jgi:hypothetical protein
MATKKKYDIKRPSRKSIIERAEKVIKNKHLFQPGNKAWELRSKHGRDKLFKTPQLMWEAACEYFRWCEENPLYESKGFAFQGVVTTEVFPKMRAMTLSQLCFYLNCSESYFRSFKSTLQEKDNDFLTVILNIEQVIYNQKFQGASADLLNANIIARDLGLKDSSDITSKGESIKQITQIEIIKTTLK